MNTYSRLTIVAASLLLAPAVWAQAFTADVSITKDQPVIDFIDDDNNAWRLRTDPSGTPGAFTIRDQTEDQTAFIIEKNDGSTSSPGLKIRGDGRTVHIFSGIFKENLCVGDACSASEDFSTSTSQLRIKGAGSPQLRFIDPDTDEANWRVRIDKTVQEAFEISNDESATTPFLIENGAGDASIYVDSNSDVGLGTSAPTASLHVARSDDTAKLLVEETGSGGNQALLHLKKTINAPFQRYESQFGVWDFSAGFFFVINDPADAAIEMRVEKDGDMTIGGLLTESSSRDVKHKIEAIDPQAILAKVLALPVSEWTYKDDDQQARHMGPMAEDFAAAFGLGATDKGISGIDTGGVTLAAIQALKMEKDGEIDRLRKANAALKAAHDARSAQLQAVIGRVAALEARVLAQRWNSP